MLSDGCLALSVNILTSYMIQVLQKLSSLKKAFIFLNLYPISTFKDMVRKCITFAFDPKELLLFIQTGFSCARVAVACSILGRTSGLIFETISVLLPVTAIRTFCHQFSLLNRYLLSYFVQILPKLSRTKINLKTEQNPVIGHFFLFPSRAGNLREIGTSVTCGQNLGTDMQITVLKMC